MFLDIGAAKDPYFLISFVVSILVIWKHRTNIRRLLQGEESKINDTNK